MSQICRHMCSEMANLKANFLTSLTKEVNPERPVARPKGIATNWYTLPKNKNLSKNEPKEPKERKEAYRGILAPTNSVRLIDKEQHTFEEKKKAEEDEIRVESERPLEGENQVPDF